MAERPPVIHKDSKSLYIIDGSKKKRILTSDHTMKQTINLILDSAVTTARRKRHHRPEVKKREHTIEEIAVNPHSQLNHLLRDKNARVTSLEQATDQAIDQITNNPTDNSLSAIERDNVVLTLAKQILSHQGEEEQRLVEQPLEPQPLTDIKQQQPVEQPLESQPLVQQPLVQVEQPLEPQSEIKEALLQDRERIRKFLMSRTSKIVDEIAKRYNIYDYEKMPRI